MREWKQFCDDLSALGEIIDSTEGLTELDRAEGYRYLTRLTRLALEMNLEHNSAERPSFYSLSHDTAKIGADNPDNLYLNANIDGKYAYEITGNVGTVPYLSFGSKENRYAIDGTMISTGEIDLSELDVDAIGDVRIVVSSEPQPGNWLPTREGSNMVIVRQTFNDRSRETPARLSISRADTTLGFDRLDMGALAGQLQATVGFVGGTARTFLRWVEMFKASNFNEFQLGDQSFFQAAGGDPNICYIYAFWQRQPGEVLRIRSPIPQCDTWNFQLTNVWMESLDYRHHPVHINEHTAELESDGSVCIHVSEEPIAGLTNNLVTTGHTQGVMLMRWIGAKEFPLPVLETMPGGEL